MLHSQPQTWPDKSIRQGRCVPQATAWHRCKPCAGNAIDNLTHRNQRRCTPITKAEKVGSFCGDI
nr:MAG TPA: hypothetical protein [Caudoviricetes sp.]